MLLQFDVSVLLIHISIRTEFCISCHPPVNEVSLHDCFILFVFLTQSCLSFSLPSNVEHFLFQNTLSQNASHLLVLLNYYICFPRVYTYFLSYFSVSPFSFNLIFIPVLHVLLLFLLTLTDHSISYYIYFSSCQYLHSSYFALLPSSTRTFCLILYLEGGPRYHSG